MYTHIDDLVESVRAITPAGMWESRRLPGSGAGPSPDRLLLGSEGMLGVITEAWVRVRRGPTHRASAGVQFEDFAAGARGVRALSQSGLYPTNCRLIDPAEAKLHGRRRRFGARCSCSASSRPTATSSVPMSAWRSTSAPTTAARWERARRERGAGGVGSWRDAFLRAPYLRDTFVAIGSPVGDVRDGDHLGQFRAFHEAVTAAATRAVREQSAGPWLGHVPVHARLPRRPGAVLHGARPGAPRRGAGAVGARSSAPALTR